MASREFVVALGYKGDVIKRYFLDYAKLQSNFTVNLGLRRRDAARRPGGRLDRPPGRHRHRDQHRRPAQAAGTRSSAARPSWRPTATASSNVDINALVQFHRRHGKLATATAVRPPARFGGLVFEGDRIAEFTEKPQIGEGWINGGFFVLEPDVLEYIADDQTSWEREPIERLASEGQLMAYRHEEFWQCMDTLRDLRLLEGLWTSGKAPWKVWER